MEVVVAEKPHFEALLTITLAKEDQSRYFEQARKFLADKTDIAGFRKGTAPLDQLIAKLGEEAVFQEFLRFAVPQSYAHAVLEKKLRVICRPRVTVTKNDPLTYEAHVARMPGVQIPGYEKVKTPEQKIEVTEDEIKTVIDEMRKAKAQRKRAERPAQKGDFVEIDFQGFDTSGAPLPKTKSANHPLVLGEGTLVRGFEEHVVGMQQGEKKRFRLRFPEDHQYRPFRGKDIDFEVVMRDIAEMILPPLDANFIESVLGVTVDEATFRTRIAKDVKKRREEEAALQRRNNILEQWLALAKIDVPPLLVDEEIDFMLNEVKINFESRNMDFAEYLQRVEKEKGRPLRELYLPEAMKRITIRLILQYLFEKEGIVVNEDEVRDTPKEKKATHANQLKLEKLLKKFL